jgi:phage tail-like protein
MAATASTSPIISASRFVLTIDNVEVATFSELTGISSVVVLPADLSASPTGTIVHAKKLGTVTPPTVTLKRGFDGSTEIWAWHQAVLNADPAARKTCALKLQDASGTTLLTFLLQNAWPSRVDIAGPQSGQSHVLTETDEFVCDSILIQPG